MLLATLFLTTGLVSSLPSIEASQRTQNTVVIDGRSKEAVRYIRTMQNNVLDAQKLIIKKFKALPESDDIRVNFDKNMYSWSVSDKSYLTRKEEFDNAVVGYEKDFKDDLLIDELRIYTKKLIKLTQENIGYLEGRLSRVKKEVAEGKTLKDGKLVDANEAEKAVSTGLCTVIPLELEFKREALKTYNTYQAKIVELSR